MTKKCSIVASAGALVVVMTALAGIGAISSAGTKPSDQVHQAPAKNTNRSSDYVDLRGSSRRGVGEPCPTGPAAGTAQTADGVPQLRQLARTPVYAPRGIEPTSLVICSGEPVLIYGDTEIEFESGWEGVDPVDRWTSMAEVFGGSTTTVLGRPARVQAAGDHGATLGIVEFLVNGTLVRLLAKPNVPIDDVLALAKAIDAPAEGA